MHQERNMQWQDLVELDPTALLAQLQNKERDPLPAARKQLAAKLERSLASHQQGKKRGPIHQRVGDYYRVELKAGRKPTATVPVVGNQFNLVSQERFVEFVTGLKEHLQSGGFDNEIREAITCTSLRNQQNRQRRKRGPLSADGRKARNEKRAAKLASKRVA
jgi:hypothetical protein